MTEEGDLREEGQLLSLVFGGQKHRCVFSKISFPELQVLCVALEEATPFKY